LARNEFIHWVEDAKQEITRERRIRRTQEEPEEGRRRPCCWPGCEHRERTGGWRPGRVRLALQREDRVRNLGEQRRDRPPDQQLEPLFVGVE
jgi:hypothetical protein